MTSMRILVAGIGNIFLGDDAFGVEVAQKLALRRLPDAVRVVDFGIRGYDLALAITDGYDTTILIDATRRGHPPGTLYLIEPDVNQMDDLENEVANAHGMTPANVLRMARSLGGELGRLYLLGCEPAILETENGAIGLSEPVRSAIPEAVSMIESLVEELLERHSIEHPKS
jgi:hydrogenase maturation protease